MTFEKVLGWLQEGLTERQIFLIWNQGNPGQCVRGVNKYGVPYDSCKYADDAVALLQELVHSSATDTLYSVAGVE